MAEQAFSHILAFLQLFNKASYCRRFGLGPWNVTLEFRVKLVSCKRQLIRCGEAGISSVSNYSLNVSRKANAVIL